MALRAKKPVQVYLDEKRVTLLDRMAEALGISQSEVLRRSLDCLAQDVLAPQEEPLLKLIGLAGMDTESPGDLSTRHDDYLIDHQEQDDDKQ
jgi:hypothetical protein